MRLLFVRHGESVANTSGRWQGQGDSPLSPLGEQQAAALGSFLRPHSFDRVISSDLQRAHHTALAVDPSAEVLQPWREVDLGAWEGLTRHEVTERFPEEIAALRRGDPIKIGGGESWLDVEARVTEALQKLREESRPEHFVMVASHGGVISSLFAVFLGLRSQRPRPMGWLINTSQSEVTWSEDGLLVHTYNICPHLEGIEHKHDGFANHDDLCIRTIAADSSAPTVPLAPQLRAAQDDGKTGLHEIAADAEEIRQAANALLSPAADAPGRLASLEPGHCATFRYTESGAFLQNWNCPPCS